MFKVELTEIDSIEYAESGDTSSSYGCDDLGGSTISKAAVGGLALAAMAGIPAEAQADTGVFFGIHIRLPILRIQIGGGNYGPDFDGDGIPDQVEYRIGTDYKNPDTDFDLISDGAERYHYGTNPLRQDSDLDGFSDAFELSKGMDPTRYDNIPAHHHLRREGDLEGAEAFARMMDNRYVPSNRYLDRQPPRIEDEFPRGANGKIDTGAGDWRLNPAIPSPK